jgi:hypothetical protein
MRPVALLIALLVVALLDRCVLGPNGPWDAIAARVPGRAMHTKGVATDRLQLKRARAVESGVPTTFVLGTSRAQHAYRPDLLDQSDGVAGSVFELTHPHVFPFEMLAFSGELGAIGADAVVLLISEYDTHGPVSIVNGAAAADFYSLGFLIDQLGLQRAFEEREVLLRLALDAMSNGYRYRSILDAAGAGRIRAPGRAEASRAGWKMRSGRAVLVEGLRHTPPTRDETSRILESLAGRRPGSESRAYMIGAGSLRQITAGPHADVQMALLEAAIARLSSSGVRVIVIETPIDPVAAPLYDASARGEFLALMDWLQRYDGFAFHSLDAQAPFSSAEFADLIHLSAPGAARFTRTVHAVIRGSVESSE